jgi:hypothetical protein
MLPGLPAYIPIVFIATVALTFWFFWRASHSKPAMIILTIWLAVQGLLAYKGFYLNLTGTPPRIILSVIPPLVFIIILITTPAGKKFINGLHLRTLLLLNVVRIGVEFCLYWLFLHHAVPELITFSGSNLDMISGITAPIVYFICFNRRSLRNRNIFLAWNIIALVLLLSVVINAILSVPTSFQRLSFDTPNIAILYFPFIWLPSFIVMVVLFSHLVMIKRLLSK